MSHLNSWYGIFIDLKCLKHLKKASINTANNLLWNLEPLLAVEIMHKSLKFIITTCIYHRQILKIYGRCRSNRQQPSPLLYSIDIWPARNSRLTQRETNPYIIRCTRELAWPYLAGSSPGQLVIDLFAQHQRLAVCFQYPDRWLFRQTFCSDSFCL